MVSKQGNEQHNITPVDFCAQALPYLSALRFCAEKVSMSVQQIAFVLLFVVAWGAFGFTAFRILQVLRAAKPSPRFDKIPKRIVTTLAVAFGQTKILRKPFVGLLHALVWWGFIVITIGTIELMVDGLLGWMPGHDHTRSFSVLGWIYNLIAATGDLFAALIVLLVLAFLFRRYVLQPRRFTAPEMKPASRLDATVILALIFILMVSLLLMNTAYVASGGSKGVFPVSAQLAKLFTSWSLQSLHQLETINWWIHIALVLLFLNILPYSKHFHVIVSVPNVFFTRLQPYAKLNTMPAVTQVVKEMLDPSLATSTNTEVPRFGISDVDNVTWKNVLDAYTCTECGRCTEVCPANNTGKKLSPRKLFIDLRHRLKETELDLVKGLMQETDPQRKLVSDNVISEEELWACTSCMACIQECPVNIDHVPFIVDMRRSLVMESSKIPGELALAFSNMENNGAPWQFSSDDRMNWAHDLPVPVMSEVHAEGNAPEVLFWVGCAGAFDDRAKSITRAFASVLLAANVPFAVLGKEETCTGDPAKRGGNEMLAQMLAMQNINTLNMYNVKTIVTACPHCYNTIRNEYPDLGGNYTVVHHSEFLEQLLVDGKLRLNETEMGSVTTYHDSCYLGRGNGVYSAPRKVLENLKTDLVEMKRNKSRGMCCGAGGAQMFKEEENGTTRVNYLRAEQALETGAHVVATACPFCMTMMTDGMKHKESTVKVYDIAELVAQRL
jgi:Fe-S oxidoreductase